MKELCEMFHSINVRRKTYFDSLLLENDLRLLEVEILILLSKSPENNTFTEILNLKDYAKSYVSSAISNLVSLGYIEKCSSKSNKKVYNLFLLEKSKPIISLYNECSKNFFDDAFLDINEQELDIFNDVISQILTNLTKN